MHERQKYVGEFGDGHGADEFGIQPDGFRVERIFLGEVDNGIAAVDAFERESLGEFLARHLFAVVFGRPAEQTEKIHESVRRKPASR